MIIAEFKNGRYATLAYGLMQYDYGQKLLITGLALPQHVEIHFASVTDNADTALMCLGETAREGTMVRIPDSLICTGDDLVAYIYQTGEKTGETTYTVFLPVSGREAPDIGIQDEDVPILHDIVQALNEKADNIRLDKDGWLQLLAGGTLIGDRVRLPSYEDGVRCEIELKNDGTAIKWRYTDSNVWKELVKLEDIRGKDGQTPEFELRKGHLFAIYKD